MDNLCMSKQDNGLYTVHIVRLIGIGEIGEKETQDFVGSLLGDDNVIARIEVNEDGCCYYWLENVSSEGIGLLRAHGYTIRSQTYSRNIPFSYL